MTVAEDKVRGEWERAQGSPALEARFRRLYLSQWVQGSAKWLDLARWDACAAEIDADQLRDHPLYVGLDLSMGDDLCAAVYVWVSAQRYWVDARFYQYTGFTTGFSGELAIDRVPGVYRGVWEYQGGGVWTPAPPGAQADILDSNVGPYGTGKDWTRPGHFMPGDYFDWRNLKEIYDVCKLLKWTFHYATTASDNVGIGYRYNKAYSNFSQPSEAAAKADAEAGLAGATATEPFRGTGITGTLAGVFGPSGGNYNATMQTGKWRLGVDYLYRGLPRTTDYHALATNPVGGTNVEFDPAGLPLVKDEWRKLNTTVSAAGAHQYGSQTTGYVIDYPTPAWGALGNYRGFAIPAGHYLGSTFVPYLAAIVKWSFTYP